MTESAVRQIAANNKKKIKDQRWVELKREIWRNRKLYPLLIFSVAFFAIFAYAPMYGIQLAFKTYKVNLGIAHSPWVGLDNFQVLLGRQDFWNSFGNTLSISLLKIIFSFPVPIILAMFLNEMRSATLCKSLQIIFTLPHFLSWVTISGIMMNLLSTDGAINTLITSLGGHNVGFLSNGAVFRCLLVFSSIWKEAGWSSIIYMAAIAGIDMSQYESAEIDGASRLQKMLHITLPGIKGTICILLTLSVGNVMNANFDQVFNMYNPLVQHASDIIDTYVYRISFQQAADYSMSTAVGLFKGIVNCILLLGANYFVGKMEKDYKLI